MARVSNLPEHSLPLQFDSLTVGSAGKHRAALLSDVLMVSVSTPSLPEEQTCVPPAPSRNTAACTCVGKVRAACKWQIASTAEWTERKRILSRKCLSTSSVAVNKFYIKLLFIFSSEAFMFSYNGYCFMKYTCTFQINTNIYK